MLVLALALCCSCRRDDSGAQAPPPTPPLSRPVIGYGVISVSYTHVTAEPDPAGLSLGYLRQGAIVEVVERRSVSRDGAAEFWVFVSPRAGEGAYRGWLPASLVQIYDNLSQAETAARSLSP
ncbi:MAG: hypothetical protein LBQ35_01030 [Spirochaetaceae bacterium]|nr:hypothetical protein [Spirochaetaceae bacterium]